MIRLVAVELTRLRWRRAVLVLLALGVAVSAVIFVAGAYDTRPRTVEDIVDSYGPGITDEIDECIDAPEEYGVLPGDGVEDRCETQLMSWYGARPLDLVTEREEGNGPVVVVMLMLTMLLVGATFAGHDWATGSISNQLLFETRRSRVWLAKGLAVGIVAGVISLAVLAAYWSGI